MVVADPRGIAVRHDVLQGIAIHQPLLPDVVAPDSDVAAGIRIIGVPTRPAGSVKEVHVVTQLMRVDVVGGQPDAHRKTDVAQAAVGRCRHLYHAVVVASTALLLVEDTSLADPLAPSVRRTQIRSGVIRLADLELHGCDRHEGSGPVHLGAFGSQAVGPVVDRLVRRQLRNGRNNDLSEERRFHQVQLHGPLGRVPRLTSRCQGNQPFRIELHHHARPGLDEGTGNDSVERSVQLRLDHLAGSPFARRGERLAEDLGFSLKKGDTGTGSVVARLVADHEDPEERRPSREK